MSILLDCRARRSISERNGCDFKMKICGISIFVPIFYTMSGGEVFSTTCQGWFYIKSIMVWGSSTFLTCIARIVERHKMLWRYIYNSIDAILSRNVH